MTPVFPGFKTSPFVLDRGLMDVANKNRPGDGYKNDADIFLHCHSVLDQKLGKVEVVNVKPLHEVVAPWSASVANLTLVNWVGNEPMLLKSDAMGLHVKMPANCVMRVVFVGNPETLETRIKYFSTL